MYQGSGAGVEQMRILDEKKHGYAVVRISSDRFAQYLQQLQRCTRGGCRIGEKLHKCTERDRGACLATDHVHDLSAAGGNSCCGVSSQPGLPDTRGAGHDDSCAWRTRECRGDVVQFGAAAD
jgi:hypothetical protein